MRFGVADYGMNVWDGALWDLEERMLGLKKIGYEGVERVRAATEAELVHNAALLRRLGMGFATASGATPDLCIQWSAAMGCDYVWLAAKAADMDNYCRQANMQIRAAARWGVDVAVHNHLGSRVESQDELVTFLTQCPKAKIIFDTGHHAAAGGDCEYIIRKYGDRIAVMHLKDWHLYPAAKQGENWWEKGRFCGLGKGNIGLDLKGVMKALKRAKWDGWCFVEHDTHLQDPFKDLRLSLQFIRGVI